jgi:hypothetical protein
VFWDVTACGLLETLVPTYQITRHYIKEDDNLNVCRRKNLKSQNINLYVGFEILTAVVMKSYIFWDITTLKLNRHFGGRCSLHLQGWRINQATDQHEAGRKQSNQLAESRGCTANRTKLQNNTPIPICSLRDQIEPNKDKTVITSFAWLILWPWRYR